MSRNVESPGWSRADGAAMKRLETLVGWTEGGPLNRRLTDKFENPGKGLIDAMKGRTE